MHGTSYTDDGSGHTHYHFDDAEVEIYPHWNYEERRVAILYALLRAAEQAVLTKRGQSATL